MGKIKENLTRQLMVISKEDFVDFWKNGLGLILWHINPCRLLKTKSSLYIYIKYMICKHILQITFLNKFELIFFFAQSKMILSISIYDQTFACTLLNGLKNCYITVTI